MDFLQSSENLFMTFLAFQDFIFYKPDWQSWVPVIAQQNEPDQCNGTWRSRSVMRGGTESGYRGQVINRGPPGSHERPGADIESPSCGVNRAIVSLKIWFVQRDVARGADQAASFLKNQTTSKPKLSQEVQNANILYMLIHCWQKRKLVRTY